MKPHTFKKMFALTLLTAAPSVLADGKPLVEQNTRTFYNEAERSSWRVTHVPENQALQTIDVEKDYDVDVRRVFLTPIAGGEVNTVGGTYYRTADGSVMGETRVSAIYGAPTFGALLGWRLGGLNLGARYQGSLFNDTNLNNFMLHKVYGEIGLNVRRGRAIYNVYLDAGYAFATSRSQGLRNGIGGKVGVGIDFLLTRYFSLGPALEFDVQAYRTDPVWVAAYGGSGLLRIGFQL
jgi:hypothetical protein